MEQVILFIPAHNYGKNISVWSEKYLKFWVLRVPSTSWYSQHRRSERLLLMQPLCLPQLQDLAVVQSVHFVFEELQGGGLSGQGPGDLLPHHLHHLGKTEPGEFTGNRLGVAAGQERRHFHKSWIQGFSSLFFKLSSTFKSLSVDSYS